MMPFEDSAAKALMLDELETGVVLAEAINGGEASAYGREAVEEHQVFAGLAGQCRRPEATPATNAPCMPTESGTW